MTRRSSKRLLRSCRGCRPSWCPGKWTRHASGWRPPSAARRSCCRAAIAPRPSTTASRTRSRRKLKILLQMSLVLLHGLKKPVIRVGRIAGQYAKPRSADIETRDGVTLPSYRGDLVNRPEFTAAARAPDPQLLLRGYERAALTLNFVRALIDGGFADLHHPEYWDLGFLQAQPAEGCLPAHRQFDRRLAGLLRGHQRAPDPRGGAGQISTAATRACTCCTSRRRRASFRAAALVQPLDALPVDRHAHRAAGRRARRVLPRHRQPLGRQGQPRHGRCVGAGPGTTLESAEPAGPADLHPSLRRQGHREVAAAR